jgi:DNA-binding NtrC family response regulator
MANSQARVLVVDDDTILCKSLKSILSAEGYEVFAFSSPTEGLAFVDRNDFDVAIVDLMMPGITGLEFMERVRENQTGSAGEFIIQTGHGTIERAVEAMKKGAYEFLVKPASKTDLLKVVARAVEKQALANENRLLRSQLDRFEQFNKVVGSSREWKHALELVEQVAPTDTTVLITGENGTGKEVIAKLIHELSPRKTNPFTKVNCSALSESLLESELFGHEKGAFTGAVSQRHGRFEVADKGTLFLDEIGEVSSNVQVKLLRFLQEREFERVGSSEVLRSNVRIIAATNRDLERAIEEGDFREDFYYRLRVIEIHLPALRERAEDIPLFAHYFISRCAEKVGKDIPGITGEALDVLTRYHWPGNVRELENSIEHAVVLTPNGEQIGSGGLPQSVFRGRKSIRSGEDVTNGCMMIPYGMTIQEVESEVFRKTLDHFAGDKLSAAQSLGVSERTLYRKLSKSAEQSAS